MDLRKSNHLVAITFGSLIQVCWFQLAFCFSQLNLGGDHWLVSSENNIPHNATVPGSVYTDMLPDHGKLSPLYRDNDVKYKWIGRSNWTYTSSFYVSKSQVASKEVTLVCEGLDTIGSVYVNDQMVLSSSNMFVRSAASLKSVIKAGNNDIRVEFKSAVLEAAHRAGLFPYKIPPECPPSVQHGECHVNLVRKEQCSFSWDWGPSFPTQGIWKPIYLNLYDSAIMTSLAAVTYKENQQWTVVVEARFDCVKGQQVTGQLLVTLKELGIQVKKSVAVSSQSDLVKVNVTIPQTVEVPLWWPRGYGSQKLFHLNATFQTAADSKSKSLVFGFRTVELIQEPVSSNLSQGLTFYFKVNGLPIFLKGSNWIPANNFQEKITHEQIQFLLQSAADVGMNAMRVWGGGIYESDFFYAVADQLGILIWQDLMFSVAMYPAEQNFLDSVSDEIQQQVERLKHHPCIIIWAGSNENEKALRQNWFGTGNNYSRYYQDFVQLYVKTIQTVVVKEDQSRPYLVSSPTNGAESVKEGYVAKDPGSELYGDIHFYDYFSDQWDPKVFRIPRAATEYGIQSWCNAESLSGVFEDADYDLDGHMVSHRQHHGSGNKEMETEVGNHMKLPTSTDKKNKFLDFIYLSQINQAMSMRTQTEHYRRHQGALLPDGRGLTMAALYWQLNDIWQAPTWASIDFEGRWKMLHYFSKSFFSPVLVSPFIDTDKKTLNVYLVIDEIPVAPIRSQDSGELHFRPMTSMSEIAASELPLASTFRWMNKVSEIMAGYVSVHVYNYNDTKVIHSWRVDYQLNSTAESVLEMDVTSLLSQSGCPSKSDCLLYFLAVSKQGHVLSSSWMTLTYPKDANLRPAQITITSVTPLASQTNTYKVELSTDAVAIYVWLSTSNTPGRFSDNGFAMLGRTTFVYFYSRTAVSEQILKADLNVRSLVDVK